MSNINEMGKWVLGEINNLGFELSEDDFQTSLTDDKSVNWYYETIKGNGYELGSVEEFKSSLMPEEKSERLRARELRKQSRQSYKDAMAAQKGMPKEKQSIGDLMGNTSQAQMFAQYAEKDRIARETADREEQAYLNAGMTERDKEARKELEKLNNPVSVWADGTFHVNTKVPVNGEFGMPTRVDDSNPVLTEWKEEKKAQMPSYVTREENSTSDIVNNTYERALNTTEGKELYIMLRNAASEDFHKTDEYKKLVKDLSMGMATEEDFIKIFNEKYGKQINEDFWEGITSQGGVMHDYYNAAWRKLNEKATAEGVTGVEAQIDEYYRQKEEDFENKVREEYKKKYGVYPEDDKVFRLQDDEQYGFRWGRVNAIKQKLKEEGKGEFQLSTGGTVNLDKDWVNEQLVRGAKQFSDDARKMIDAAVEEKGFFKGVGDAATDVDTFDMGLSQLIRNTRLMDVVKKVEADESLSKEEQLLMDSALNYFATSAYYSDKLGRWYKAGTTTAASMPFMIQFMLSSGALAAIDSATKTGVSAAMKGLTHAMVKWGKKKAAKTVVSSLSGLVSSVVGAAAVTALWSPAKIAAGGVERQIGDIKPELDGDAYTYGGRENAQSAKEAYLNSFADAYIENLSEMVLANTFDPLKTYIKGTNLFGKISKNDVFDFLYDVRTSPVMKTIREKAKFGGLFEEMMEEELGGLLRWGVMSDVNSAEEAGLDLDGQIDIFLGLAPTSLLFSSTGLASHYGRLTSKSKEIRKSLATEAQRKMFDELMKESRSGIFGDQAHDFIRDVVMNDKMSIEQKKAALEVVAQQYSDVLSEELNKQVNTVERERYDKTVNEFVDRGRYGDTQRVFITTDAAGHNVLIVGGHVEFMDITEGGVTQRVVDVQASDANLQIRKNFGDGRLGEIETVRAKFLNRLVSVVTTAEFKHFKQTQFNADIEGKPTFEYSGHVFDTETGKNLGKKDEYEKEQKKVEDKVKSTNNEKPKANTKEHKIKGEFTLKVDGKNKKVEVYIKSAVQKEDGSLDLKKSGKITIMEGGMVLQGTRQEDYVKALSEHLKQEHEKAVQEFEANNQPAVQPTPIVSEADVEAAKAEEANAAKEAELDAVRRSYPYDKQGNIDIDKLTPEQLFVFENDREGRDIALETVVSELNGLHEQLSAVDTNEKLTSESQKKKAKYKLQDAIKVYEDIIIKYEGQEALDAINAARIATPIEQAPAAPVESPAAPVAEPTPAPEVVPAPEVLPEPEVAPEVEMEEQIEDTPVEEEVAEEVAAEEEVPVAEVPAREPIDLSSDNIVFVKQAHRVAIAERGEDGVLRFVDNGKVVGDTWMEMPNKILVYYNGQPCYALTTVSDPKYFSNEVNIVSKDYIGNVMKVSRWDLTNEDGKKLLKTGAEIQEERVNSKYKSIADFLNTVIYTDVKNNIKLTLRELFAIPVIDANRGRLGAPSYRFQVERFIENQSSNREDKAIRDEIRKHLQELVQDWNAYVKINNLTDVVDEENMSSFYSAMKQQGGYKSNGLLVQTQDFSVSALNSADITKNPVLQLAVVLDQASELGMLDENIDMSAVDNFSSIKQKLAEPSEMTTEDIQQEMKDIELERAKSNNSVLGKNRYNKLKRELNKRANTNPTDVAEPAQEPTPVAQGMSKSEQRFVDMLAERDFIVEELNQGRGDMQRLEELNRVLGILGVEPAYPNAQVQETEIAEEVAAEEEVPVAEVPAREPIDLSSDNIVFVKQAHRVAIAERGEDGVLRFVDNGKVVGDTWMEMPNKILVYYNGQPCYALTTVSDPKYFSNEVNIVSKDYIGNVMKVSRWDLTNEDGKKLLKTGAEIQEERVNSKYKSIADFLNTVIYTDVKNNIKLTLRELFAIPVIDANRGRLGAPSYRFQVERFIENQSSNREDKAIRDEIRKHLQELVQDWNAYVKINNLTDVVDEENMSSFYSAMKQQGGYKSNGLLVQTQDFSVSALNSADITKNPVLQLAVVLDQASELGMLDENIDMSAVDNFSSIKQKLAEPSEMTTEDIQQEMKDIELERAKSNNSVLGKNRYNKLKRELNKRANTNPTDVAEPAQEPTPVAQGMSKSEQRFVDMLAERDFIVEELNQGRGDMQRLEELNRVLGILGVEPAYPNAQVQETEIAEEVIPETTAEDEAPETIAEEVLPEEETEEEVPTQQVSAETIKREIEKLSERLGDLTEEQEEEFDAILAQIQEKNALLESIGEGYKEEKTEKPKASQNKPKNRGIDNFSLNRDDMAFMVDQQVQESAKAAKVIINLLKKAGVRVVEVTEQQIEQMVGKDEYKKLTADGVVYGTAHKGIIYLNSEHLNPNTPLHEFTHLWVDWYKNEFKEEWERFVKLAVKSKVAKQLKTKDAYKNLSNDDLASEVLSHYTGYTYGAMTEEEKSEFENLMNTTGSIEEQIAEKPLRKAIRNFWKRIISIFDKTILDVKEEESIDDMIRRFSKLPMLTLIQGEEAVAKFMTGKSAENLDNSKKSSNFAANNENYERTEEFRELQERSLGLSQSRISEYQSGRTKLSDEDRRRVGGVFQRLMESDRNGGRNAEWINLTGKGSTFKVAQVNPAIFHDVFQICRNYLPNGELVDLHNYYANCKCFISEDGLCGFAIEPDGNLVSVFSLNPSDKRGFLYAIKDLIRQEGATHLDCYVSNKQPLAEIYEKALGFHVASEMDYNMKYDHDNIAENHGMPKVAFMVDRRTEKRNFDGESYNAASEYQQSQTSTAEREQIVAEAKSNGTYMLAPNGQPTNLTEDQWVTVRTQAFKDYFGDWQNDTANASVVVDENGEPMVVYHGSRMAGFDKFGRGEARDSQGIYTTPNRRAAESYATSSEEWKSEQTMPEAEIGVSDQHGVYSLFVNMRNPKTIDFGGKRFDEYGETKYEVATNEALDNGERGIIFDTLEEAEAYIAEHPEEDLDYVEKRTTSDELLVQAKEEGYDGVIFTNIIDSRYPDPITNYVPFESNQVKSATQNIGTFNAEDDRIQFMVGPTASNSDPTLLLDTEAINRIKIKSTKAMEKLANPNIDLPKELGGEGVAKMFDRTEGIRRIMNSIAEYRKENGKPKMGEGFDVRTMVETMDSKINNQKKDFDNNQVKRLQDIVYKFCAVIEKSKMYKDYKREQERNQSGEPVELTPVQFLERYLIACDSIEREVLSGNPRGMGDFLKRMGVTVIDFHNEFRSEFAKDAKGKQMIDELWEAVRGVTRVSLEVGVKSGLISQEEFERQSQRQFYVPERDYAEVEANKELWIEGASWRRSKRGNRLRAMQHAEGGKSLAANVLANMLDLTYDAIAKAEMNKVKVAMFDLLSNNEDWCRANKVPIPITVWYEIDGDGNVVRKSDEPTRDERDEMRRMKSSIRRIESSILDEANKKLQYEQLIADNKKKLTGKLTPAERAQIENDIQELKTLILECEENIELANQDIDNIESSLPYVDSVDARNLIFETKEQSNAETVIAFIDGAPCEMHFPNMVIVADCLNNVAYRDMYFDDVKKWTSYVSAIFTVYNPTFFTVNIARDVIWTLKTGYAEYGWQFPFRFAAKLAAEMFTSTIWKAVAGKDYSDTKHATHMKEFFEGGGNTGYTQLPEMQRIKKSVAEWGKKKRITWGDVGNVLSFMNEWSEVWTRSAAYSVVRDMGYNQEEGIRAAKNLSVNFNRKGLGHPFINFFSSFSMFANATIQGACGFYRKFKGNEDKEFDRFLHTTRAIMSIALTPALAGFFSTLMNPDDEEDYMVTDYDRDNNMVFGNIRIPLSEQIKPFWVIGVNIALGMQGKRNSKDIARSIINSFALNLMPFPNSFNSTTQMVVDSALGYNTSGLAGAVDNLLTPQILKQTNGIANNRNFFGGKLRFDIGDIPEYTMGDNEPYLYRKLAEIAYYIGGGDENLSSRTVRKVDKNGNVSYETLGRAWDLNPKEIEAWANSFVPSGIRDIANVAAWAIGRAKGDDDAEIKLSELSSVSRFYKPQDKDLNRYMLIKQARDYVKPYQEHIQNVDKSLKGGAVVGNEGRIDSAKQRKVELESNFFYVTISKLVEDYNKVTTDKIANKYNLEEKDVRNTLSTKRIEELDARRDELLRKIVTLMREKDEQELYNVDTGLNKTVKYTEQDKKDVLGINLYNSLQREKKNRETRK